MRKPDAGKNLSFINDPRIQKVLHILAAEGEGRLVGGCVRDALLGRDPLTDGAIDIDVATDRTPDEMEGLFERAGIRVIPTGKEHGTLTVLIDNLPVECTTLRADEVTDGRHAEVRFTRSWDEDWRRRDFTINAIYADQRGRVWDPAGGIGDLASGVVQFIGEPDERIAEDALRMLRFFRFSARFAAQFDAPALEAIGKNASLLDILSRERVWSELSRTFVARRAPAALGAAERAHLLQRIIDAPPRLEVFAKVHAEGHDHLALLAAALWPDQTEETLRVRLKPPRAFLSAYAALHSAKAALASGAGHTELLFRHGRSAALSAARLLKAEGLALKAETIDALEKKPIPLCPISGEEFVLRGVPPGPLVGQALAAFTQQWLAEEAPTEKNEVERLIKFALLTIDHP